MRAPICLSLIILFAACSAIPAAEPKRDRFGDPLPEGAVARLGNLLMRNRSSLFSAAFTKDGKSIVACDDHSLSFWSVESGKTVRRVDLNVRTQVRLRRLSGDGKTLIQSHLDNNVLHFFDTNNGIEMDTLDHKRCGFIQAFDVSRDGKILAAVHGASIALWDVPSGKLLHEFKGPRITPLNGFATLTAISTDGKRLVLPHLDGSLHLIDVVSGKELCAFEMPPLPPGRHPSHRLERLTLSPDGRYLAYTGWATPLTVCEVATGKRLHELAPPQSGIASLAFTANGRFLAVAEYNHIRLFGIVSGKEIRKIPRPGFAHGDLLISPDGRTLATANGCHLHLWDMTDGRSLHPLVGHDAQASAMAFFPDGKRLVVADSLHGIKVWNLASSRVVAQRRNNTNCVSLAVDADGESVRFAGFDATAHRWNPRTGQEESRRHVMAGPSTNKVSLSPDGRSLAVLTIEGGLGPRPPASQLIRIYDLKSNQSIALPRPKEHNWISQQLFTPDSRYFASVGVDSGLYLWERDTGKLAHALQREGPGMQDQLVFAADGRSVALIDGPIRIREIAGGGDRLQIPVAVGLWHSLAYSPDGRFLAHGQTDGAIRIYSAATGKPLARWQADHGAIRALAFSRDGRLLASGGENGIILLWEVPKDDSLTPALKPEQVVAFWQALGESDAATANRALAGLAAAPEQALALFKERLRPVGKPVDAERMKRLIAELDDDDFTVREKATHELGILGPDDADALRQALNNDPSAEAKRRIEKLLARLKKGGDPQHLRFLRALEVLERIGTPEAKDVLRELGRKPLPADLRDEIRAGLQRMNERP